MFEIYADSKGLLINPANNNNRQRRRALLLHSAGPEVQDIFATLPDTGEPKDYDMAVAALNNYFVPKKNTPYARHLFRAIRQNSGETVTQFYTRLLKAVKDCDYGVDADNQIRDQILSQSKSEYLQRKLLEEGDGLTLARTLELAKGCEDVEREMAAMSLAPNLQKAAGPLQATAEVNYVKRSRAKNSKVPSTGAPRDVNKPNYTKKTFPRGGRKCYRCGRSGHYGRDPECPAKGKMCGKCGGADHFAECCKTKRHKCRQVEAEPGGDQEYGFQVTEESILHVTDKICVNVGGVDLYMVVDSGATTNLVDSQTWNKLKQKKIKVASSCPQVDRKLYPYGSDKPLPVRGTFRCTATIGSLSTDTDFIVIQGDGPPLLGRATAIELGVLHIGLVGSVRPETGNSPVPQDVRDKYPSVFEGVGKLRGRQVRLHINDNIPAVAQPLRRTPYQLKDKVEKKVQELLDLDIIEPVKGPTPWVNPVVVVPKAKDDIRLCVDMRRANEAIERTRHPIPTTDEVLQGMNGSTVFSKLDLKWGYHQLELEESSRDITVFATSAGLYRYKRLSFGINSASEQYQHEVQRVLAGLEGAANISDDIIIHGKGIKAHDENLDAAMKRIEESGLTLNPDKCQFRLTKLVFMGMLASEKGIGPTEARVEAVTSAREPQSASEVRSFLGLVNFSARFIPNLATVAEPLRQLTKKNVPFKFGEAERSSFNKLKELLAKCGTLAYYDPDAPTQVITDASPVGLGAVLVQKQNDEWVAVSYASRSLTDCEQRYSQTEKEALGVVWGCEKFHQYIYGMKEFDLVTDHKALEQIYGPRSRPCARIERWVLRLQPYRYRVVYKPGKFNIADSLSRLTSKSEPHKHGADEYVHFVVTNAVPQALAVSEIEAESEKDGEIAALRECLTTGELDRCERAYKPCVQELCVSGSLVLRGSRIIVPAKLRPRILSLAHEGHMGVVATKQRLRSKVWWPQMDSEVERYCRGCHGCQLVAKADPPEPIRSTELPPGPWQDLAVDLMGPLPSGHTLLVVVDYYSRYYEVDILRSTTTDKVITSLKKMFSRHGYPVTIKSDNGPQFVSQEFKDYCKSVNVTHQKVTARWAQANGEVERQNRSLLKRLRIAQAEKKDWQDELTTYLLAQRSQPHQVTGVSPAELLFRRKLRTKIPDVVEREYQQNIMVRDRDAEMKGKQKLYADERRNARYSEVNIGDRVLVHQDKQDKLTTPFNPTPHTVVSKKGNSVVVQSPAGVEYSRNTTHVKRYYEVNVPEDITRPAEDITRPAEDIARPAEVVAKPAEDITRPAEDTTRLTNSQETGNTRPQRVRTTPKKFQDFIM